MLERLENEEGLFNFDNIVQWGPVCIDDKLGLNKKYRMYVV